MRWSAGCAVLLVVLTACSGDDDTRNAVGSTTGPTDSVPSLPTTDTDRSETTEAPQSTTTAPSSTTITTSTTSAPATTIDPATALAQEVEADYVEAQRLAIEALQEPGDESKTQAALDARSGPSVDYFRELVDNYRMKGYAVLANPAVRASQSFESPAVRVLADVDVVEVTVCEVDPWVVVEVGAGPGGSDAIVDDNVYARRQVVILRKISDRWRIEGTNIEAEWAGVAECAS